MSDVQLEELLGQSSPLGRCQLSPDDKIMKSCRVASLATGPA
jgi:hypothetical protein